MGFYRRVDEDKPEVNAELKMSRKVFKEYRQGEGFVLPPYLDDMIEEGHLVRVVNRIIEGLDLTEITKMYQGGGAPAYHPVMMLKVLVYAYMDGIYTSRKIEKAVKENVVYMWLASRQEPDFRTINNFRLKLKDKIEDIFRQVVISCFDLGLIGFKNIFVDGTKVEANSNRHKMVWKKNVVRMKERMEEKIDAILEEIERLNEEEKRLYGEKNLPEVGEGKSINSKETQEKIKETIEKINRNLMKKKESLNKRLKETEERKEKYEKAEEAMGKRNSYSKMDQDATAMQTKEGVIKPCYNSMIATENQIIVNYEVEQNASDGSCFKKLMEGIERLYRKKVERVCGDSAFGNTENYEYCEKKNIEAFLKYGMYHAKNRKEFKENKFRKDNFAYNKDTDTYICPNGERLEFIEEREEETATGYKNKIKIYQCKNCQKCQYKNECTKGTRRSIQINEKLEKYKAEAEERLKSPEGKILRKQRGVDVETPFGDIKHNNKYRRFLLRGKKKVEIEMGLLATGHNLKKIALHLLRVTDPNKGKSIIKNIKCQLNNLQKSLDFLFRQISPTLLHLFH